MAERYFSVTLPDGLVKEPVIYTLVKRHGLAVNVFRASVTNTAGWIVISLSGDNAKIDGAALDLRCRGATVEEGGEELMEMSEPPMIPGVRVRLTVPRDQVREPILGQLITNHNVIINIRRARIDAEQGTLDVEISGPLASIDTAMDALKKRGVRVDPIEKTVIE